MKTLKKTLFFSILFALLSQVLLGQTQIYVHDFETAGGYTASDSECSDGSGDYFERSDGSDIGGTYNSPIGTYFFAAQDVDASGCPAATLPATLLFDDINISGYSSLELRVYLAEDDDGANEDWDAADYVHFDYDIDNSGTFSDLLWIESSGVTNTAPYIDTDYDGTGDGTEITSTFVQFTESITGTGSLIDIQIEFNLNSGDEDIAIDHIEIWGTAAGGPEVDWCNLQWPTSGNIRSGDAFNVYAQVYEAGVTDAAGQGADINAWIGYSLTDSDPSTGSWTWVPATYGSDQGNNDEYTAEIGSALAAGTYYFASRFQLSGGVYKYGGYNSGGGGFWDGATNVSNILTVDVVDWCNIQSPENGNVTLGAGFNVYAQIFEDTYTDPAGQAANISSWIGYSTVDNDPVANPGDWTWVVAGYNTDAGNNDEYILDLENAIGAGGTYYYISRFQINSGPYAYGGFNTANNEGLWSNTYTSGTGNKSGQLIITAPTITLSTATLTGFTYVEGSGPSAEQSYTVEGANLTDDIVITPPTNWEISLTSGSSFQTTPITLTQSGGTVSTTTIYTRMVSGLLNSNSPFSGNIANVSTADAITENVAVDGTVTLPTSIFISEISPRGYNGDFNDEFIEIINDGASSVDLTNWTLEYWEDGVLEEDMNLTGTINSNSAYVIAARSSNNLSEDFLASFTMSGTGCYVILKESGVIKDEAGTSSSDEFSSSSNYEFTDCGNDNKPTANWDNLGSTGGTPGVVNCAVSTDNNSDVDGPVLASQPNIITISSLVDTDGEEVRVFDFDVYDYGTTDGLATHVTQVTIKTGANNTADWSATIGGAKLSIDGGTTYVTTGAPTINASSIVFPITSGNLDIADGGAETVSLFVYLNNSGITDGQILEFKVDGTSHGFTADASGSTFAGTFTGTTPSPVSNQITIDVTLDEIRFTQQPSTVINGAIMSPSVTVSATDTNGNVDVDFDGAGCRIGLTTTGTFDGTATTEVNAVNGVATFDNLVFSVSELNRTITTTDPDGWGFTNITSNNFDIVDAPQLVISEVADPTDNTNAKFVELYNSGGSTIDLAAGNWYLSRQANGVTWGDYPLTGSIGAGVAYVIATNSANFNTAYGFNPDEESGFISGNGNDGYFLYSGGDHTTGTLVDAYGVLNEDGTGKAWEYTDSQALRDCGSSPQTTWTASEWTITSANVADMTPGEHCAACVEPTSDATNVSFSAVTSTSFDLSWTDGNGSRRIVVLRKGAIVSFTPTDNTTYTANTDYSSAIEVGNVGELNKVVYNGNASTTTITGLEPGTKYYVKIYEYGCNNGMEDYFTSGTPATGNETTLPENVSNFTLTCITNTTAELTWNIPTGSFDGVLIAVRESTNTPSDPTCDGSTLLSPDTDFSSALVYCGNGTSSKYVYNATGTSVLITGLTSGADYVFKAFTFKGSNWTNGTQTTGNASVSDVSGENTVPSDGQVSVMWTNPTTCYDEIMVVAHEAGSVTQIPSGDGSSYTANATFGSGTNMGLAGDYVMYKGTVNNFDAIGLTNLTQYCFKIFTRKGSDWSAGVEICETPADVTVFNPGEFVVVGFDSKVSGGSNDAIYLMNFVDIKEGTTFKWVNSRFETGAAANERTLHWGGSGDEPYADPAFLELKWQVNGQGVIPAGSIISFETSGSNLVNVRIDGLAETNLILSSSQGSANVSGSEGDQMWLVQGSFTAYGTDAVDKYSLLDGTVLYGLTSIKPWVDITSAVSDDASSNNSNRESRLHPDLECFNIDLSLASRDYIYYQNGTGGNPGTPLHTGTKRALLIDIQNSSNWDGGTGSTNLDIDEEFIASTVTAVDPTSIGKRFSFTAGNSDGTWIGGTTSYLNDWFTCKNWEGLTVPDSTVDVTIPSVTNAPVIDHTSTKAAKYEYIAECNNLTINGETLTMEGSHLDTLYIHGNLSMTGTASFDLDDSNTATSDGIVYLYGNYDNQVSGDALKQGNSTFNFVGANEQTMNSDLAETFYNLNINNTSLEGVQMLDNLTVSNIFNHTDGTLDLNGHNFLMSGEYNRTSGDFEGDVGSNFTISGTGNLDSIYFVDDLNVNEFVMSRDDEYANLMTNLTTAGKMAISSDGVGGVIFNAGKEYSIGGVLSNFGSAGSDGVIIKSDASGTASVLQNSGAVNATCERYMQADRWHFLSIPLSSAVTTQLSQVSWGLDNPNFYWYDETVADFWQGTTLYTPTGWTNEANVNLDPLKGYIHRSPEARTYVLTGGNLKDADYTITLHYSENGGGDDNATEPTTGTKWNEFEGWNMIPNEFASAIDWDQVWNSLSGTEQTYLERGIYYLDNSDLSEKGGYKFYQNGTSTPTHDTGITLNGGTKDIPANQTVFIKATPAGDGNTITIPKSARLHSSQGFWKKDVKTLPVNAIKLSISKDNKYDETVVRTLENATYEHDYSIDAYKMFAWDSNTPQILTRNNDNSRYFGINSIPNITAHTVVPIVTYVYEPGEYSINNIENAFVNTHVWLEDRTENVFTKLRTESDVYTFNQTAQQTEDRFYLLFDLNHKPSVNIDIPDQVTNKDELYSYTVADNTFVDVDFEDVISLTATLADGNSLPAWLTFNSETKEFSGIPDAVQVIMIKLIATDEFGANISQEFKLTVKSAVSVSELTEDEVSIYPNPANDKIYVEIPNNNKSQLSIVDITGQELYSSPINSKKSEIDLRSFAKGIYFVKIKSSGKEVTKKIVLE